MSEPAETAAPKRSPSRVPDPPKPSDRRASAGWYRKTVISFRPIRYFIATADAGKVSLAVADPNVSQSAISAAIKRFEDELEAHLFERPASRVTLTCEGHQFLQHARNIIAAVSETTRAPPP